MRQRRGRGSRELGEMQVLEWKNPTTHFLDLAVLKLQFFRASPGTTWSGRKSPRGPRFVLESLRGYSQASAGMAGAVRGRESDSWGRKLRGPHAAPKPQTERLKLGGENHVAASPHPPTSPAGPSSEPVHHTLLNRVSEMSRKDAPSPAGFVKHRVAACH